jgi:hypothetical protein
MYRFHHRAVPSANSRSTESPNRIEPATSRQVNSAGSIFIATFRHSSALSDRSSVSANYKGLFMNTCFPDRRRNIQTARDPVFGALREKLAREVSSSALLARLLEKVNSMQRAQAEPETFRARFEEFVCHAEECMDAVKPFFPALVVFLPSHRVADAIERRRFDSSVNSMKAS